MKEQNFTAPIVLWLALLPEPYNKKALKNMDKDNELREVDSFWLALNSAFLWIDSPEGHYYWNHLSSKLYKENL